jgi:hypothetical protein
MNLRLLAFPCILLASVVFGGACTASAGSGSIGGATIACAADGAGCLYNEDCCNFSCVANVCASSQTCTLDNSPCTSDAECCSNLCASDGLCGLPNNLVTSCVADGSPCDFSQDCCNYQCVGGPGGVCASSQTCTLDNSPCTSDAECCTNICASDRLCGLP